MPNLVPPVTTVQMALEYKQRLLKVDPTVTYLMTLYLHPSITPEVVREAKKAGIAGIKSYPAGLTTNSESGVTDYQQFYPVFAAMEEEGLILVSTSGFHLCMLLHCDQKVGELGGFELFYSPSVPVPSLQSMMRPFHLDTESCTLHWETMTQFRLRLQRSETAQVFDFHPSDLQQYVFRDFVSREASENVPIRWSTRKVETLTPVMPRTSTASAPATTRRTSP